jgi:HSP20 family protein
MTPAVDILDDGDSYQVVMELPGVSRENLTLTLEKDALIVHATRPQYDERLQVLHDGRASTGAFERRLTLGNEVDRGQVTARLENGLLYVTLPRRAEEKRRRIEVEVRDAAA